MHNPLNFFVAKLPRRDSDYISFNINPQIPGRHGRVNLGMPQSGSFGRAAGEQ
jgi:hypothetical protein